MTQEELDTELRERFLTTLGDVHSLAKENRDVESLGNLAQLIGTCIDWDKEKDDASVGFHRREKDDDE